MDVLAFAVGFVLVLVAVVLRPSAKRRAKQVEELPRPIGVLVFRGGPSDSELLVRLREQRALGLALGGPSWKPRPQARA